MEQNENYVDDSEAKSFANQIRKIGNLCEHTNYSISIIYEDLEGDVDVTISARKRGALGAGEFSSEQLEIIKVLVEEKLPQAEDKKQLQDIINACKFKIAEFKRQKEKLAKSASK